MYTSDLFSARLSYVHRHDMWKNQRQLKYLKIATSPFQTVSKERNCFWSPATPPPPSPPKKDKISDEGQETEF